MGKTDSTMAHQIAQAALAFQRQRTGHAPRSVNVVMSENTLVVTLPGVLTPAETALAASPEGAGRVQEFHRQLFATSRMRNSPETSTRHLPGMAYATHLSARILFLVGGSQRTKGALS